jgi:hypothetical protein
MRALKPGACQGSHRVAAHLRHKQRVTEARRVAAGRALHKLIHGAKLKRSGRSLRVCQQQECPRKLCVANLRSVLPLPFHPHQQRTAEEPHLRILHITHMHVRLRAMPKPYLARSHASSSLWMVAAGTNMHVVHASEDPHRLEQLLPPQLPKLVAALFDEATQTVQHLPHVIGPQNPENHHQLLNASSRCRSKHKRQHPAHIIVRQM